MTYTKLQCKVKIGVSYEPKWFERRYTQGTYSAKGIMHDEETIWLQQAMLGRTFKRRMSGWNVLFFTVAGAVLFLIAYY
jgi:hypothetical protein